MTDKDFIRQDNNYRTLKAFRKAECIYDVTYYFANKFLGKGDRTIDQMVQAARSGKQNLAEGNIDGVTSKEMEIRLTNVNRASLHELLLDYEDYLRVRGLEQWSFDDPRCVQTRAFCKKYLDSAVYREKIQDRSDETIANIAITLIHQCDVLIRGLIEWQKRHFLENGGIKEEMYRARKAYRDRNGFNGQNGMNGMNGQNRMNGFNGQNRQNGQNGFNGQQ
ncbi:MAG: four helix bundle suffix domain-containing protein [Bacteroidales bacterium]|nr:four helix bundle suffix domain-containing protein [Bacteroidales bacterium]